MTISDRRFAAELITEKGKVLKFDDISCMLEHMNENSKMKYKGIYISDFISPNTLTDIQTVSLIKGDNIASPMGGNIAAFSSKDSAAAFKQRLSASELDWNKLKP
jgi:copper chaperone NosL